MSNRRLILKQYEELNRVAPPSLQPKYPYSIADGDSAGNIMSDIRIVYKQSESAPSNKKIKKGGTAKITVFTL